MNGWNKDKERHNGSKGGEIREIRKSKKRFFPA